MGGLFTPCCTSLFIVYETLREQCVNFEYFGYALRLRSGQAQYKF
ncbi:hypothetical protein GXM_01827 [Nostoc sphaeroides CCNUC1]|uniref:Uncharacterized protein n=1 Tax=Nostoc sphaeroides CCNUC1 TaxID=2653204 RepID=A0A5P8VVF6_9NOSO|nr:hypothetical protein GXM_01827 [Nostoc sphaeroides CCNUC1]